MGYDTFYLGWAAEATEGTSTITGVGDTAYIWGSVDQSTSLFEPEWGYVEAPADFGERKTSEIYKTTPKVFGNAFSFLPRNGIPFYYAMGKSSTAGTVHTLTTQSAASGVISELPTLTFHAERLDSAASLSDWSTQYKGMKNVVARVMCGDDAPTLTCSFGWLGMSVADPGFVLTSKPSNPTGTHTSPLHYLWSGSSHKYDSATVNGVTHWEIIVDNGTYSIPPQYGDTWASAVHQGPKQTVALSVQYRPDAQALHDSLLAKAVPSKDWEFEFVRDATDDKLKFTCKNVAPVAGPLVHPVSADEFVYKLEYRVEYLQITVTDQINQSFYGE